MGGVRFISAAPVDYGQRISIVLEKDGLRTVYYLPIEDVPGVAIAHREMVPRALASGGMAWVVPDA